MLKATTRQWKRPCRRIVRCQMEEFSLAYYEMAPGRISESDEQLLYRMDWQGKAKGSIDIVVLL